MIRWFARNGHAANFLMLAILLAGTYAALFKIPTEVTPSYRLEFIRVSISLPGGTPKEVEQKIVIPVENALDGLAGIKAIHSEADRSNAQFTIHTKQGVDMDKLRADIESRIDRIDTFPREIEPPRVRIPDTANWFEVISVVVSGNLPENELVAAARQVRDDLQAISGISKISILDQNQQELSIEVNQRTLQDHGLTLSNIANAVRQNSLDLSAGSIRTEAGRILLRSSNQALVRSQFENIIIQRNNGAEIKLGTIANIREKNDDNLKITRFNGENCIVVEVKRLGDEKALHISDQVHAYVAKAHERFPEGVKLSTWDDDSVSLRGRISTLFWNLLQGSILVFLLLGIFLRLSLAIWVVIGIPVAFAGALMLMPSLGTTANVMSLFGFIIVLGIVVDDAIVTGEHIFSRIKTGMDPLEATVLGTKEIAVPVTFGILTTIVAFIPLAYMDGWLGVMAKQIPYVVIPVLIFSLVETKLILPSHLRHIKINRQNKGWITNIQKNAAKLLELFTQYIYTPLLKIALQWRYATLALFTLILLATVGLWKSGQLGFQNTPTVDRYFIYARLHMAEGTTFERTDEAVEQITAAAYRIRKQFTDGEDGPSLVGNVLSSTGGWPGWGGGGQDTRGYVLVEIVPPSLRKNPGPKNDVIAAAWRKEVGIIQGSQSFNIRTERSGGFDYRNKADVEIELRGNDNQKMVQVARDIEKETEKLDDIYDAWTSVRKAQNELQIQLTPYGRDLGLTQENLARQVRRAFHGEQAQRIQRGEDNLKVMVRFPKEQRKSLHTLDNLKITLPNGSTTSLKAVADVQTTLSPPSIERRDGARSYIISATPISEDTSLSSLGDQLTPILNQIVSQHPGLNWRFTGRLAEEKENQQRLWISATFIMFTLFALLAIPFRSLLQPIFVLLAVPFGAVGAVAGHILLDITPSYLSLFGILALAGVVVNDSLVMVDFTNKRRKKGKDLYQTLLESGASRFRPILLTSVTTFAGLLPLIFERSIQAQFLIPMAVSLAFGILFATVITLFLIPCAYMATEDIKNIARMALGKARPSPTTKSTADNNV